MKILLLIKNVKIRNFYLFVKNEKFNYTKLIKIHIFYLFFKNEKFN